MTRHATARKNVRKILDTTGRSAPSHKVTQPPTQARATNGRIPNYRRRPADSNGRMSRCTATRNEAQRRWKLSGSLAKKSCKTCNWSCQSHNS